MAAAEQVNFIYTGGGRGVIPDGATHVTIHDSITVIPAELFREHPNIVELICHEGVLRIEDYAFQRCRRLNRVIIPGVKFIGKYCFGFCVALIYVECPKLERIGEGAFAGCESLSSIKLQLVKVVERVTFAYSALTDVEFGSSLELLGSEAFFDSLLERITIPLKNGLITSNSVFQGCIQLRHVDIVGGEILHESANALLQDIWKNDVDSVIRSIDQILANTDAGSILDVGGKAWAIREWIECVLHKLIHYKAQHRRIVNEAASLLQIAMPYEIDVVMNNVLPFLELPSHTFEGEEGEHDSNGENVYDDGPSEYIREGDDNDMEEEGDTDPDMEGCDEDGDDINNVSSHASFEGEGDKEIRKRRKI